MRQLLATVNRTYGMAVVAVLVGWTGVLYGVLRYRIGEEVNERMLNRLVEITSELRTAPPGRTRGADFTAWPVRRHSPETRAPFPLIFSDSTGWEPLENAEEPYRVLRTRVVVAGRGEYRLRLIASLAGTEKLLTTILLAVGDLLLTLVVVVVALNRWGLARLWRPFYATLAWLQRFRVEAPSEADTTPPGPDTVREFAALRHAIGELAARSRRAYQEQKQFTENAAHELQTPLAVAGGQIETLLQSPDLSPPQAEQLHALSQTLGRMTRLNRALLLLARLDNGQVGPAQAVPLAPVVAALLDELAPAIAARGLQVRVEVPPTVQLIASPDLVTVLLSNLLRNAVLHNQPGGWLLVQTRAAELLIENSGPPLPFAPDEAFRRFTKGAATTSTGLGLALVTRIAALYALRVRYTTAALPKGERHALSLSGPALLL